MDPTLSLHDTRSDMTSILVFIVSNTGAIVMAGGILLFAAIALVRFLRKVAPVARGMDQALVLLMASKRQTAEGFAAEFEEFNATMLSHEFLSHPWSEFRETLILPRPNDRQVVRNVTEAAHFFNVSTILEGRVNLRFYREVPNYLPGLGILGTFTGLTIGIYRAKSGFGDGENANPLESLQDLLDGAALAFLTSIAGLVGSIIYSIIEKRRVHELQVAIDRWCDELDARLERVTLEHLSAEHLEQAKQQTLQLERFNTDLAISISSALDEKLAGRFAPLMERTLVAIDDLRRERRDGDQHLTSQLVPILRESVDAVRELGAGRRDTDKQMLEGLLNEFKTILTASAGGEMDAIARTLQDLTAELKGAASIIAGAGANAGRDFETATREAGEHLQRTMDQMITAMAARQEESEAVAREAAMRVERQMAQIAVALEAAAGRAGGDLSSAAEGAGATIRSAAEAIGASAASLVSDLQASTTGFAATVDRLADVTRDSERVSGLTRNSISELQETAILLDGTLKSLEQAGAPLAAAGRAITDQLRLQDKAIETLSGYAIVLREAAANVERSSAALEASWDQASARYTGLDESLRKSFVTISDGIQAFATNTKEFVVELDKSLSRSMTMLSGAISELNEAVDDLSSKK
jgi:hypothetical protein